MNHHHPQTTVTYVRTWLDNHDLTAQDIQQLTQLSTSHEVNPLIRECIREVLEGLDP